MKTTTFLRSCAMVAALVFVVGCSKDKLSLPGSEGMAKAVKIPEEAPVPDLGGIKGMLFPAPSIVTIKVYNEEVTYVVGKVNVDGSFFIENLVPGLYNLSITYVVQNPENTYTTSFDVMGVEVDRGAITSLGVVTLPWTY